MNEQNVKALFFSQYLGQKVFYTTNLAPYTFNLTHEAVNKDDAELNMAIDWKGYLLLRSVSQLTDDEAIIIAHQNRFTANNDPVICAKVGRDILKRVFDGSTPDMCLPFESADYLRGIGILLPFTFIGEDGKPQTYSEDEILTKGWAKLV